MTVHQNREVDLPSLKPSGPLRTPVLKAAALMVLAGLVGTAALAQVSPDIRVGMYGFGPVRVGMTVDQAASASGWKLVEAKHSATENCWYAVVSIDAGVRFMVEDGVISRVDIGDSHHPTVSGVRIGDAEERAKEVYGRSARISPHKYDDLGHYMTIRSRDGKYALVLETNGKQVTGIHAGRVPSAEYVEGCS